MSNVILTLENGDITINNFTTMDISRRGSNTDINITNSNGNLDFNDLFSQIVEQQGESKTLSVTVETESSSAKFSNMTVNYNFTNSNTELLHFSNRTEGEAVIT